MDNKIQEKNPILSLYENENLKKGDRKRIKKKKKKKSLPLT
jgi:hypothetical protein